MHVFLSYEIWIQWAKSMVLLTLFITIAILLISGPNLDLSCEGQDKKPITIDQENVFF